MKNTEPGGPKNQACPAFADNIISIPQAGELRYWRRALLAFVKKRILPLSEKLRHSRHFNEWSKLPLNYWRYIEIPVTLWCMNGESRRSGMNILDIGSPKLPALFLAVQDPKNSVTASDISPYFVRDFERIKSLLSIQNLENRILDARNIDAPDNAFDQVFSISVLEHIPGDGDTAGMKEIARVLKPGGTATLTLPFSISYCEEWLEGITTYWEEHSEKNEGKIFFQRRYGWQDVLDRIVSPSGLGLKKVVLTGERPIGGLKKYSYCGKLPENCNFMETSPLIGRLKQAAERAGLKTPHQWIHSLFSFRYHFFSGVINDDRLLNIAVHLEKR
jgi:SAM-dependent methyltransferase